MGFAIWSMHYVGMLAFVLPVPVLYHVPSSREPSRFEFSAERWPLPSALPSRPGNGPAFLCTTAEIADYASNRVKSVFRLRCVSQTPVGLYRLQEFRTA